MDSRSLVSVVVTTRNEEKNIENCLLSIKEQTYSPIEIIVVDNNSEDNTKEISKKYTDLIFNKGPERSVQRNYGMIKISKGKFVMFVDADMILSPCLIEHCVQFTGGESYIALHIPEIILGKSYWSKVRRFERSFYNGTVIDGARFFKKETFKKVGGFDENLNGPEDWDIDKKIKQIGTIGLLNAKNISKFHIEKWILKDFILNRGVNCFNYDSVIYHNESDINLKKYLAKKGYYAKSFNTYIEKWGRDDPEIKKQFGLVYRYFGVLFERKKWKNLVKHLFLTLGLYFMRGLVGFVFLIKKYT